MSTKLFKTIAPLVACTLVFAMCHVAAAFPFYGGNCTATCHGNPGGSMTIDPSLVDIAINSDGVVTFDVGTLSGSKSAIALLGLDDPNLDTSIIAPDNWTLQGGGTYTSDFLSAPGQYVLDLGIGPAGVEGLYGITAYLMGNGQTSTAYDFSVNVIPEPASLALALSGLVAFGLVTWRRRRAG
ncbi:MAG: PEP-CTERM sorting domain-containing protein [Pirellulales bacterium]